MKFFSPFDRNYLLGSFAFDFLSTLPFDAIHRLSFVAHGNSAISIFCLHIAFLFKFLRFVSVKRMKTDVMLLTMVMFGWKRGYGGHLIGFSHDSYDFLEKFDNLKICYASKNSLLFLNFRLTVEKAYRWPTLEFSVKVLNVWYLNLKILLRMASCLISKNIFVSSNSRRWKHVEK